MKQSIKDLFIDIQDWMMDNDYECGEQGGELYNRITRILTSPSERCLTCDEMINPSIKCDYKNKPI